MSHKYAVISLQWVAIIGAVDSIHIPDGSLKIPELPPEAGSFNALLNAGAQFDEVRLIGCSDKLYQVIRYKCLKT